MNLKQYLLNKKRKLYDKEIIIYNLDSEEEDTYKIWHDNFIILEEKKRWYGLATKQERVYNQWLLDNYGSYNVNDIDTDTESKQVFIYIEK